MVLSTVPADQFQTLSVLSLNANRVDIFTVAFIHHRTEFDHLDKFVFFEILEGGYLVGADCKEGLLFDKELTSSYEGPLWQFLGIVD